MTIAIGTRVKITKGCADLGVTKGQTATVINITNPEGEPTSAWVLFQFPSHRRSMYVRYAKHLAKPEVRAHTGNPLQNILFKKA